MTEKPQDYFLSAMVTLCCGSDVSADLRSAVAHRRKLEEGLRARVKDKVKARSKKSILI